MVVTNGALLFKARIRSVKVKPGVFIYLVERLHIFPSQPPSQKTGSKASLLHDNSSTVAQALLPVCRTF